MPNCDHKHCSTPYCPFCGAGVAVTDIQQLRAHVAATAKNQQTSVDRTRARAESAVSNDAFLKHQYEQAVIAHAKWERWLKALDELIAKAEEAE